MEFIAGPNGPIIPDPEKPSDAEHIAQSQAAAELLRGNIERIEHFKQRVEALGRSGRDTVITLLNVDDPVGGILAEILMPNHDWQRYRDAGEMPLARGMAPKEGVIAFLQALGFDTAAATLQNSDDLKVLVLEAEVAVVVDADLGKPNS